MLPELFSDDFELMRKGFQLRSYVQSIATVPNFERDLLSRLDLLSSIFQFLSYYGRFNHTEGSNSQTATRDLHNLTVERLRALLKAKGLSTKGKKASFQSSYSFNIHAFGRYRSLICLIVFCLLHMSQCSGCQPVVYYCPWLIVVKVLAYLLSLP